MTFATVTLICAAGLLGPLLAAPQRLRVPVLVGELAAGVVLGDTGVGWLHPHDTTFSFMADIGFALVMFVAGSHVPIRDSRLRESMRSGLLRAVAVGAVAAGLGWALAGVFDTGHAGVYAVVAASSSAAFILPLLDSVGLTGASTLDLLAQVAIADTACIVALPLVIDPARAGRAALGALAVIGAAVVAFMALRAADRSGARRRVHHLSEERKFALELRVSLLALFALAALARASRVSIMLAGFALGLVVTAVGEPRRLARQLFGLTEGFFGPLFFIWIGATLDLRALGAHPKFIGLGVAAAAVALASHLAMRLTGQPWRFGAVAAAQLGVPIAAVALAARQHLLAAGERAALILAALITIAVATVAATRRTR